MRRRSCALHVNFRMTSLLRQGWRDHFSIAGVVLVNTLPLIRRARSLRVVGAMIFFACSGVDAPSAWAAQGDCSQPVSAGAAPSASDCLFILKVAVGAQTCAPACICDPSGGGGTSASDALLCLKKAVGQGVTLNCPCDGANDSPVAQA